jgi:hypothetical protein
MFIGNNLKGKVAVPYIKTKLSLIENEFYSIIFMVTLPKDNMPFLLVFCCQVPFQEVFIIVNPATLDITLDIGYKQL